MPLQGTEWQKITYRVVIVSCREDRGENDRAFSLCYGIGGKVANTATFPMMKERQKQLHLFMVVGTEVSASALSLT